MSLTCALLTVEEAPVHSSVANEAQAQPQRLQSQSHSPSSVQSPAVVVERSKGVEVYEM